MPLSSEQLFELTRRPGYTVVSDSNHGRGPHSIVQKPQANPQKSADRRPKSRKKDEANHPAYHVSVTLKLSDRRVRDADGALSTLLDCLIRATRRLGGLASEHQRKRRVRAGGTGGSVNQNHQDQA